jgi:hypothetical protein
MRPFARSCGTFGVVGGVLGQKVHASFVTPRRKCKRITFL